MSVRVGSVRLRSSLTTKMEQDCGDGKRRRHNNNNNNNTSNNNNGNGNGNNGQLNLNGNGNNNNNSGSSRGPRTRGAGMGEPIDDDSLTTITPGENVDNSMDTTTNAMESSDSSSTDSSSDSESDSSGKPKRCEMDENTCEIKRVEFQDDLSDLEKQFLYMRELLYQERLKHVEEKIEEVRSGKAKEYLNPLEQLQENMRIRIEVAGKLRQYRLINLKHKFEAEEVASYQNFESEKLLLREEIKTDLEEKINRLEEDRNNDFTSELWLETALKRKNKKSIDIFGEKRKKPITVSGPYIVYMLNDVDIVEDWTIIKKALAAPKKFPGSLSYQF